MRRATGRRSCGQRTTSQPEEARGICGNHAARHHLRDRESRKQQRDLLSKAIAFIDEHYADETISLDRGRAKGDHHPNYFSAMFTRRSARRLSNT
jgi:hypothetical protein